MRADVAPDDAILKETARRKHNLVVMGVGRRPGEKLFFGDTAAALLGEFREVAAVRGELIAAAADVFGFNATRRHVALYNNHQR